MAEYSALKAFRGVVLLSARLDEELNSASNKLINKGFMDFFGLILVALELKNNVIKY